MCSATLRRPKRARSPPGTPGPHTSEVISVDKQRAYPSASTASTRKIRHLRQQLFGMPELRSGTSTSNLDAGRRPARTLGDGTLSARYTKLSASNREPSNATDDEQREASPRRRPPPRCPAAPDLEDALTRLTQTVQQMVTHQQQPAAPAPGHPLNPPEDPNFNWVALRSPLKAPFPLPPTGTVQRIVAGLFAKIQSGGLTGRDLHEAKFAVDVMAD